MLKIIQFRKIKINAITKLLATEKQGKKLKLLPSQTTYFSAVFAFELGFIPAFLTVLKVDDSKYRSTQDTSEQFSFTK